MCWTVLSFPLPPASPNFPSTLTGKNFPLTCCVLCILTMLINAWRKTKDWVLHSLLFYKVTQHTEGVCRFVSVLDSPSRRMESGGIAPGILNLGTRWDCVVSYTHRSLTPYGKSPQYPLHRKLYGARNRS